MTNPFGLLIASGCSFTANKCWPHHLANKLDLNKDQLKNYGVISSGNGRIARSIVYGVSQALKTHQPEDILVGVMWSAASRYEVFQEPVNQSMIWKHGDNVNPTGFVEGADKNWILIHSGWDDVYSKNYYTYQYDEIGSYINSLEHVLRVQWFLKMHKVNYFMTSAFGELFPDDTTNPNINYLYEMIDHSKFLPVKNCMDWTLNSGIPNDPADDGKPFNFRHPTDAQHRAFAEMVIYPYLESNYWHNNQLT